MPTGDTVLAALEAAGLAVDDNRAVAPEEYIRKERAPGDIRALVLHQTGFSWKRDNPNWRKVRSHFVVKQDGSIAYNFAPTTQMRYGSAHANPFSITIEHEGNFANAQGGYWKGDKFGRDVLAKHPAQIAAGRQLITTLRKLFPSITHVYAHRQWEAKKSNCCGPELWKALGRWAIERGLTQGGPGWHWKDGLPLPASWGETGQPKQGDSKPDDPPPEDEPDEADEADARGERDVGGVGLLLAGFAGLAVVGGGIIYALSRPKKGRRNG